ncbi:MAG: cytochrome b5-like heme/steroid binding domain-containing protein [Patescibacteria group bacterium]
MKKTRLFLLLPLLALTLSACSLTGQANSQNFNNTVNTIQTGSAAPKATGPLTMSELALHNSKTDCWQLINGQVYDLSAYTASGAHPGGDKILQGCGQDASALFASVGKHQGQATAMLPNYLLGPIQ